MLNILSRIKHSPKTSSIRRYTNLLYYDPDFVNLGIKEVDTIEVDGYLFKMSSQVNSVRRVKGNPWFSNIRPEDIAVDIGANIGAVTIPLAFMAKKVYAVEPLYWQELQDNVDLNCLNNVEVIKMAIGFPQDETGKIELQFAGRKSKVDIARFRNLKAIVGEQINFLKMDGEGCEWTISPEELEGIRELRIEFHIKRGKEKKCHLQLEEYLNWAKKSGYKMVLEHPNYGPDPYDAEDYMLRASLGSIE